MNNNFISAFEYNKSIIESITDINEPLLNNYGLSLLTFRKFLNSGEFLYLCNHPKWMTYSFENMPWSSNTFHHNIRQLQTQKHINYIWPSAPDHMDRVYCALYDHNIWNGIVIYRKYTDYIEAYAFAATKQDTFLKNFYINNIDILNQYISYFKNKTYDLIHPQDRKVFIPYDLSSVEKNDFNTDQTSQFFQQASFSKYYLVIHGIEISLSKREIECLYYLSKGKTFKEIAIILNLSTRTIERYLDNAKKKSRTSKNNLIEALLKSKLITNNFSIL